MGHTHMDSPRVNTSQFARSLSDVFADTSNLLRKELELARAEVSAKMSTKVRGSVWLGAAALMAVIALLLVAQSIVFAIASRGIELHWASLIVAGGFVLISLLAFWRARSGLREDLMPTRTISQIKNDVATMKEQWS